MSSLGYVDIGSHKGKSEDGLQDLINSLPNNLTYQIVSGMFPSTHSMSTLQLNNRKLYIHGTHKLNISTQNVNLNSYIKDLQLGSKLGCSGVVIHVGNYVNNTSKNGLNNMGINIQKLLEYASENCPLLLETPAGQGTELLVDIDLFINFYNRFRNPNFKLCIDTCHVFEAGYDPYEYIMKIVDKCGLDSIKLIHFNDAKEPKGSKIDRHANIGEGHIDYDILSKIYTWRCDNNINIVLECGYRLLC